MEKPQIIYITLSAIGLLLVAHDHGKERTPENFWRSLISTALTYWILIAGGFFK